MQKHKSLTKGYFNMLKSRGASFIEGCADPSYLPLKIEIRGTSGS
jgi:hypothetical protein